MDAHNLLNGINGLLGMNVGDFLGSKAKTITEPDNINEAIKMYKKRLEELAKIKELGFDTLSEYTKVKEAEATILRHQRKSEYRNTTNADVTSELFEN